LDRSDSRAVSEVVGYVIIAGLILTSISIAYVNGYPALQDVRDEERQRAVQAAFSVMGENIEDLTNGGGLKRQTEMNLIGDSLGLDPDRRAWINVSITNTTSGEQLCDRRCNVSITPIVYQNSAQGLTTPRAPGPSGGQVTIDEILYENGAVIRDPGGNGSGMYVEPNWVIEDEGVIINIVETRGSNTVTGEGTFRVITNQRSTDSLVATDDEGNLNVSVTVASESLVAWGTYMNTTEAVDSVERDSSSRTITMHINETSKAVRKITTVDTEVR
jgi:hypothetical protein